MKIIDNAWLFDVDGVIVSSFERKVTNPQIIELISKKLQADEPVSLVTDRELIVKI